MQVDGVATQLLLVLGHLLDHGGQVPHGGCLLAALDALSFRKLLQLRRHLPEGQRITDTASRHTGAVMRNRTLSFSTTVEFC